MDCKGIIFDVDGTLLASSHVWEQVDEEFVKKYNLTKGDDFCELLKPLSYDESVAFFVRYFRLDMTEEEVSRIFLDMVSEQYRSRIEPKCGAVGFVRQCARSGIKMCAATAGIKPLAEAALKRTGILESLEFIITCDEVGAGKQSPLVYLTAARRMGLSPEEVVVFEDPLHCILTAAGAGFGTVAVSNGQPDDEQEAIRLAADRFITDYSELL